MIQDAQNDIIKEEDPFGDIPNEPEIRLYELGYHLLPTVAEEMVGGEATKVKDAVESHGGIVMSQEMPKTVSLAYSIPKVIANQKKMYASAHFGWFRFQMPGDKAESLREELKKNLSVLRFILFRTVQEKAPKPPKKMKFFGTQKQLDEKKDESTAPSSGKSMSEADIEKTIEELMVG